MKDPATSRRELGETVRDACVAAALAGYEDAATAGLCQDGAFEAALGAIHRLDLAALTGVSAPVTSGAAAAQTGALAAGLLEGAAGRSGSERAGAIASRAAGIRSALESAGTPAALDAAARCAQVATLAAELAGGVDEAASPDAAVALRLAASAAECALALAEDSLRAAPENDATRSAERRIWRTRLLLRRARPPQT
jgi:hypothetical protein